MKKRGIIIIFVVIAMAVFLYFILSNSGTTYDLTEKFNIQGRVIDYGTYENFDDVVDNLGRIYARYLEEDKKVYFVLGNKEGVILSTYEEIIRGNIGLITGRVNEGIDVGEEKYITETLIPKGNKVEIVINKNVYEFTLKENENVYFIIEENE